MPACWRTPASKRPTRPSPSSRSCTSTGTRSASRRSPSWPKGWRGIPDAVGRGPARQASRCSRSSRRSYSFDIEPLKKQNLGKAEKDLEKVNGATPFVRAYVTQNALGGHSIPVSKGAIDVLYAVGVINDAEADKGQVPGPGAGDSQEQGRRVRLAAAAARGRSGRFARLEQGEGHPGRDRFRISRTAWPPGRPGWRPRPPPTPPPPRKPATRPAPKPARPPPRKPSRRQSRPPGPA